MSQEGTNPEALAVSAAEASSVGKNYGSVGCAIMVLLAFAVSMWTIWQKCTRVVGRVEIQNTVLDITRAVHQFHDQHESFPRVVAGSDAGHRRSWRSMLGGLDAKYRSDQAWDGNENMALNEQCWWASQCER